MLYELGIEFQSFGAVNPTILGRKLTESVRGLWPFKISVTQYLISTQMLFGTCSFIIKLKTVDSIFRGVNSQVMVSLSCWLSILQYIKDKTKGTGSLTFFNFAVAFLLQKCL